MCPLQGRGYRGPVVPLESLVAFLPVAALVVAVPGPSVLFTVGRALAHGRRSALLTVLGNGVGLAVQVAMVAVGLAALVAATSWGLSGLRVVGGAYLVWLGVVAVREARRDRLSAAEVPVAAAAPGGRHGARDLVAGFATGVTNPKTLVFLAALLPQFVAPGQPAAPQVVALGLTFAAVAVAGDSVWAVSAAAARQWFAGSPARMTRVRTAGGAMLVGLGVYTLASGQRSA